MASTPMQMQNGGFAGMNNVPSLPQNLTKEQIQQTFMKYQQMKNNGVSETDPEFLKARNLLQAVQQKTAIAKQQQMHRARVQQMQQRQNAEQQSQQVQQEQAHMQNGSAPNGSANGTPTAAAADGHSAQNTIPTPTSAQGPDPAQQSSTDDKAPSGPNGVPSFFSKKQLDTLRLQIAAFKHLSKNTPLPVGLRQQLFQAQQAKQALTPAETGAGAQPGDESQRAASIAADADALAAAASGGVWPYKTFDDPYKVFEEASAGGLINYGEHRYRDRRLMMPSIMPTGIDVDRAREEREIIVYNRIQARKAELEKLPANLGVWNTENSNNPEDDGSLKLKAIIELKMLNLLPKQRAMRAQIAREVMHSDNLVMTANRSQFRRIKKQSLREARITEKLEKQQRDARETKEKRKQTDFLRSITEHQKEIQNAGVAQRARVQKLGRMMMVTHQNIEKEEQKRVERTAKQRLQALKANDEETYLKLLGQAKDTRISHLLKQTDGFLQELAASVKAQQRSAANRWQSNQPETPEPEVEDDDEEDEEEGGKKVDYYEVAHRIKEEVHAQATNLVGGTLKEYQLKGLQWMISLYNNNLNGILADEMGLGKTIQTISLITYLIEKKKQQGPYLVVVPLSTLTNWNNEFEKWAPSVEKIVYKGPPNQRKQQQQQIRWGQFQVLLTTYEFIIKDRPVLSKVKWLHMIVDEGHRMKNAGSKLSQTITQYYTTRYRLILTGTPLQNNLPELWALLNFVLPTIFKSVKSFDEWFNTPFANTGTQDKMELTEEESILVIRRLHKVLRPFLLRRLKKDVEKDLPDKQERVIKCNFSSLQAKLYRQLGSHNRLLVSDGKGGKTGLRGLSNMLMQLRKLCNHPFVFEQVEEQMNPGKGSNDMLWRTSGKFELLDRVLPKFQATGHRVLMFFQMTQIMNIMEDFLRLRGITYLRLDGSTKSDDRSELLRLFNAPDSPYFCFLLSTRAGGLGLNLQTADTVIIYDSDWNPHQDLQAQDRAHRIGQKNEVKILRLITSNSVEEKILERANFKLDMDGKVIQAGKFDNKSTNEERDAMLRIMLESAEAAETMEQDEQDDDDLNLIMMRSEAELELFQKMDQERLRTQKYGPGRKLPRLMGESELPDIYMNEDQPVVEEALGPVGRGARERTRVKYDDGLTEEQWLEAVDNDDDTIEEAIARHNARNARRQATKDKKTRGSSLGTSPIPSRDSSESPAPKKRGRKPKAAEKRKADDVDPNPAPRKRGRQPKEPKIVETLTPEERERLQKVLDNVFDSVADMEEEGTGRDLTGPFMEAPPKSDYPDYYMIIKNPIGITDIQNKINSKRYQSLKEYWADMKTLCNNCKTYNEDGSMLYKDAQMIEEMCLRRLKEETDPYPELQDFDDATFADGASTAPISSVGTPLAGRMLRLRI
ncbi:SNF2-family ATP-dependent chromatin remodeling factor snf21 [Aulographum hederae CBS 113979]|uniref:SNF2-family ATP-dependent chromatin remodeling factor snf21 n=1 Tax=Aulographum hederae CBS 113979 TaxID=1176131 RepID=A0A6G1GZ59_9PEZI|nr:SNF2-family ATP-dependent chromatin remodeling factor snf21 [Aulographum hederae CBS 113979]